MRKVVNRRNTCVANKIKNVFKIFVRLNDIIYKIRIIITITF